MSFTRKHIFNNMEKKIFLDILKQYKNVVENKETDAVSLRKKNEAWELITSSFNASPFASAQVQSKQLRKLWANLKQRQREALSKERQNRMATGGGPSTSSATIDADVAEIAPALIVGVENATDSDSLEVFEVNVESSSPVFDPLSSIFHTPTPLPSQTASPTPPPLPISTPMQTPTPTSYPLPTASITTPQQPVHHNSFSRCKSTILDQEFKERQRRAEELHDIEKKIKIENLREARARADLAELLLQREYAADNT